MQSVERRRVGVIGDPVAHSISPAMQQPALDALGIDATYARWHTPAVDLPERIGSLRQPDVFGANVTVPHKRAVMPLLDQMTELATRAGAVNTIINSDGRLLGDNTDVYGFATSLTDACKDLESRDVVILGAGGAARAVALALGEVGVRSIAIHNRDRSRANRLVDDLRPLELRAIDHASLEMAIGEASILVNATSLGWNVGESPIDLEHLGRMPAGALVVDLTYRDTDLLLAARERGLATLDGLPMLVHQGARALELWTGQRAPVDVMMDAALNARSPRT